MEETKTVSEAPVPKAQEKKASNPIRNVLALTLLLVPLAGVGVGMGFQNPKFKDTVVSFFPERAVFWVEDQTGLSLSARGFKITNDVIAPENSVPDSPFSFSVHFNGDGVGEGERVSTKDFSGLNEVIQRTCEKMDKVQDMAKGDAATVLTLCDPNQGAKLFSDRGRRIFSFLDIRPNTRTYVVPQGVHFVWPLTKVGDVFYPEAIESPVPGKPIRLRQLSMSPRVFSVENFMSQDEMDAILHHNKDLVRPSEVGFSGWRDSTRTSSTAWDFHSWAAKRVQRRSFDLLGMEFNTDMADATQVLRYNLSEWYKPHTDWFDEKAYEGHDPTINNGTNRFATVFLYLTDVEEGGHTVFPLSKTHKGYNGEVLVHPGTEDTPGYISQQDAEWVCNTSSAALRSEPKAGNAVLFYSQGPDGSLDKYSLHGGCPVISGLKWSANVWIWNRPKPGKEKAKDGKPSDVTSGSISLEFSNKRDELVKLYWDDGSEDLVFQTDIPPNHRRPMTTYHGHKFIAKSPSGERVFSFTAHDDYKGKNFVAEIV